MTYDEYISPAQPVERNNLALTIYDGYIIPEGTFSAAIDVKIDPVQYWRDRPLFLKNIPTVLNEAISLTAPDQVQTTLPEVDFYIEQMEKAGLAVEKYKEQLNDIVLNIKKYSEINEGKNLDIEYPNETNETLTLNIKDDNGNVISTVETDANLREPNITPEGEQPVTILTDLPGDYTDDQAPQEADEPLITSLPESYIKEKLWIADQYQKSFFEDAGVAAADFQSEIDAINTDMEYQIGEETYSTTDLQNITSELQTEIPVWYGIPLINLSSASTPLNEAVILQIDTRNNWTLHLTNVVSYDAHSPELRIKDVQIPPNKRFLAGVYVTMNTISIYLKIEGDPNLYTESIIVANPLDLKVQNYGSDAFGQKRICGTIYDYFLWDTPQPYYNNPGGPLPEAPSTSHAYDNAANRIRGKYLYPRKNWQEPAYNGGDWIDLNDTYRFIYNGYLEGFFCKDNIKYTDFTILWYQWQFGYPTGIRTLIADSVNNNYIRYDYDNFELLIDINNVHYREHVTLPENMWFQVALRFKQETNELTFSFIDFWYDKYEEVSLNIGVDLNFELISLWGRYNKETKYYEEIGRGVFGLVIIEDRYIPQDELIELYNDHKNFLGEFNLNEIELPY